VSCTRNWYSVGRRSRPCNQPDYGQVCLLAKDPVERSRSRTVSRAGVLGRCPVEKNEKFPIPRTSRVVAALIGAHRGSERHLS